MDKLIAESYEEFLNEAKRDELVITPQNFSKNEKILDKTLSKVFRGTGILKNVKDVIAAQMSFGKNSKIKSITLTNADNSNSEIYVELIDGTIYDRANLELEEILDNIKMTDNSNAIATQLLKKWSITAMTKNGDKVHFVWVSKSNFKAFGDKHDLELYDIQMKIKGDDYTIIGNASTVEEMTKIIKATGKFN